VHAAGEEEDLLPRAAAGRRRQRGRHRARGQDHNEIRETTVAVDEHEVGTDAWWEAFRTCREATVDHLAEEENDVLPPFQEQVSAEHRDALGMRWLEFHERTRTPRGSAATRSTRRRTWRSTPDRAVGSGG
jgi:hypothetical protein